MRLLYHFIDAKKVERKRAAAAPFNSVASLVESAWAVASRCRTPPTRDQVVAAATAAISAKVARKLSAAVSAAVEAGGGAYDTAALTAAAVVIDALRRAEHELRRCEIDEHSGALLRADETAEACAKEIAIYHPQWRDVVHLVALAAAVRGGDRLSMMQAAWNAVGRPRGR